MTWSRRPIPEIKSGTRHRAILCSLTHLLTPTSGWNIQWRRFCMWMVRLSMFRHLIIISFVFFLPELCAAQTPDPGGIRVGDRWSYDIKDGLTGDLRNAITVVV